jgi:Outer membrane protein beta-barrel domain
MKLKYINSTILLVLLCAILAPSVVGAQIRIGVRAGLNVANISLKSLPNKSERFGYHAGIFTEVPLVPGFMSIQPELSYSTKGTAFKPINEKFTLDMNYVDFFLPVAFKLGSIDLQVGPFASYMISKPDYTVYNENKIIVDAFNKLDAGLTAGLSYNFNKILIGIRYNQGFIDVTKANSQLLLGSGKNTVGQVSLGYKF